MTEREQRTTNLRVWLRDGFFHCSDGAGTYVREATSDEKLLWAMIERMDRREATARCARCGHTHFICEGEFATEREDK